MQRGSATRKDSKKHAKSAKGLKKAYRFCERALRAKEVKRHAWSYEESRRHRTRSEVVSKIYR